MELQIKPPNTDEYKKRGQELVSKAEEFAIQTINDMEEAAIIRETIKDRQKSIVDLLKPFIDAAFKAHRDQTARRNEIIGYYEKAEAVLRSKMNEWKKKEDERLALEQKLVDEEAQLEAAAKAEEDGNEELAKAIMDGELPVMADPVEKTKVEGVSFVDKWSYEIIDEDNLPREFMMPDEKGIKRVVTAMKGKTNIPGVRVFKEQDLKSKPKKLSKTSW